MGDQYDWIPRSLIDYFSYQTTLPHQVRDKLYRLPASRQACHPSSSEEGILLFYMITQTTKIRASYIFEVNRRALFESGFRIACNQGGTRSGKTFNIIILL